MAIDLHDDTTILALVALGLGVANVLVGALFLRFIRRIRRAQQALLAGRQVDLVEFAVGMQARMERVEEVAGAIERSSAAARADVARALRHRGIVRYDALRDAGGHQSVSLALLDDEGSGVVVSAIQGREQARIYVKDVVHRSAASVELTPEEHQAVERAGRQRSSEDSA